MRRFRLLLLWSALLAVSASQAQDVYEFTYRFPDDPGKTVYKGLLFRNPDKTGFLRLTAINKKTGKKVVYDFSFSLNEYNPWRDIQQEGGVALQDDDSTRYWYAWTENFRIKEGTEPFDFDYLRLWFRQEKGKKEIEPCLRTPFDVKGRYLGNWEEPVINKLPAEADSSGKTVQRFQATGILSFKKNKSSSFSKAFLSSFFIPGELFREGTYTKKQVLNCRNNIRPTLHLINVINSRDEDISVNCIEDGKYTWNYFSIVAEYLELRFSEKKITGADFSVQAVRSALHNLRPGKDDIVVFFYSGHGFRWKGDTEYPFPQMGLYYGTPPSWNHMGAFSLNIEDVYKTLQKKGARLNLVLSDCCNTIVNRRRSEIKDTSDIAMLPGVKYMNKRTVSALFLQARASLLVSAAERGQEANCSRLYNGFFTYSLYETMTATLHRAIPNPQWTDIIKETGERTLSLAAKYNFEQKIIFKYCPDAGAAATCVQYLGQGSLAR